jgi:hypothetical protein
MPATKKKMDLLGDDDASDNDSEQDDKKPLHEINKKKLEINKKFALKYEKEKQFKDLQRSKSLHLDSDEGSDGSTESESEDEDGDALSSSLELRILHTINR